jgi:tRNA A37 threonylcarbamoyladenosine modification protein TsaB
LILFSSDLEFEVKKNINMNKLIVDAAGKKIFLMLITEDNTYNITHDNSKSNYEMLTILINNFLFSKNITLKNINKIYVNRGPGSFAGIRNSLSIVKAFNLVKHIDYYCYSLNDFKDEKNFNYTDISSLCDRFNIKKNLIKPIYIS